MLHRWQQPPLGLKKSKLSEVLSHWPLNAFLQFAKCLDKTYNLFLRLNFSTLDFKLYAYF